jgi:hypothetical protein
MKQRDRYLLTSVCALAVVAAFWLVALHPKVSELSASNKDVAQAQSDYATARQEAQQFAQARLQFPRSYATMARLGKAVPANTDQPSLIYQLNQAAEGAGVRFASLSLNAAQSTSAPAAGAESSPESEDTLGSVPADAAATAGAPAGATTGAANLRVMHYDLRFNGEFFRLEDLVRNVKRLAWTRSSSDLQISGRLLTVDSITFDSKGKKVTMSVTAYLVPASEGLFAGATPEGPASPAAPAATASSGAAVTPPTAAVTP